MVESQLVDQSFVKKKNLLKIGYLGFIYSIEFLFNNMQMKRFSAILGSY